MLKLTPDQIGTQWDSLRPAILEGMGDGIEEYPNQVLEWLQSGRLECWVVLNAQNTVVGVVTTCVIRNEPFTYYSLLVFSLWAEAKLNERKLWDESFQQLLDYTRAKNCVSLLAYTLDKGVAAFLTRKDAQQKLCFNVPLEREENGKPFDDSSVNGVNLCRIEHRA